VGVAIWAVKEGKKFDDPLVLLFKKVDFHFQFRNQVALLLKGLIAQRKLFFKPVLFEPKLFTNLHLFLLNQRSHA
jgi:hypothetical protein